MENIEKLQKITEALYRVTELYSDKEPLKWQLRAMAVELFDFLTSNEEKEIFDAGKAFDLIRRLTRLLQLAYASSAFVSSINFEVLRREYLSLNDSLQNLLSPVPVSIGQVVDSIGQTNGQEEKEPKETKFPLGNFVSKSNGQPVFLEERKRRILASIKGTKGTKGNEWLTIREISASLPEYGEKSVQRDLLEMVGAGILKKAGDKRWRKYGLAMT